MFEDYFHRDPGYYIGSFLASYTIELIIAMMIMRVLRINHISD